MKEYDGVLLASKMTGLPKDSVANVSQLVTVDKAMVESLDREAKRLGVRQPRPRDEDYAKTVHGAAKIFSPNHSQSEPV